ncbi:hypothetical protein KC952_01505 [Candidatus Saccharibacteria bacterium]|nr:hypothetical protein [Candidatus Saccharibacteria bacterium]
MILLLDTSTGECRLTLINHTNEQFDYVWQADRELSNGLLKFIVDKLKIHNKTVYEVTGIGVFAGPGSFTGLRIGMTILNTLASDQDIPIVSGRGDNWADTVLKRLLAGENDHLALPFYGSEPNITKPKK